MIVKMKFLTVSGPKEKLEYVIERYLTHYEFQIENALTELKDVENLRPYTGVSPYRDTYAHSEELLRGINGTLLKGIKPDEKIVQSLTYDDSQKTVEEIINYNNNYNDKKKQVNELVTQASSYMQNLAPFTAFHYNLKEVLGFKHLVHQFGKLPRDYYGKYKKYFEEKNDFIFVECSEDDNFVWGAYFAPVKQIEDAHSLFASLHFESYEMPAEYSGEPNEVYKQLETELATANASLAKLNEEHDAFTKEHLQALVNANEKLYELSNSFDVHKMVACTNKEGANDFFIMCGWMPRDSAKKFEKDLNNEPDIFVVENADNKGIESKPPTKLKNPKFFKPFEMFIEMYGLPDYNEIDPTMFVALTYAFIFGVMFGDVGQGLCLVVLGFLLYKLKGVRLAAIISCAGVFSTIFGFMFGSIFGFENIIDAIWLRPGQAMIENLPFMGNMNTVLVVAIAFGMFLILTTMVMHVINGIKAHKAGEVAFDTNSIAGLVFYGTLIVVIVLFMTGNTLPSGIILGVLIVVPLILMALKEPLTNLVEKKPKLIEGSKGMFAVQTFFEMFETLLSFLSNTISFVRIGAFAISHGAMMEVVLMLAGAETGNINWIVVVLGNILVCGLEGLIVGIQVLRLEYYEMFSRFYKGDGKAFKPFKAKKEVK